MKSYKSVQQIKNVLERSLDSNQLLLSARKVVLERNPFHPLHQAKLKQTCSCYKRMLQMTNRNKDNKLQKCLQISKIPFFKSEVHFKDDAMVC